MTFVDWGVFIVYLAATGAIGALVGSMDGKAGAGALIGAGVGLVGQAVKRSGDEERTREQQEAAAAEAAMTRTIDVPNANGSYTPVRLRLVSGGWQGPRGEVYPTLPTVDQLRGTYGL